MTENKDETKRVAFCIYCGKEIIYHNGDALSIAQAWEASVEHDQVCPGNPLVRQLREIEARLDQHIERKRVALPDKQEWQGMNVVRKVKRLVNSLDFYQDRIEAIEKWAHEKQALLRQGYAIEDVIPTLDDVFGLLANGMPRPKGVNNHGNGGGNGSKS